MSYGGYVGKILRVDLTTSSFKILNTFDYVPKYIGGGGIGFKILWDETNENTTEWSPENTLIFATGPCSGTPSPASSRTTLVGISAQSHPKPWGVMCNFGGDFAAKLKWAGYDAIVITGKATSPKYLYVSETETKLEDATHLWGEGTRNTQGILGNQYGVDLASIAIGPAGENRVRWAAPVCNTQNAPGQGGFGAIMGDKKLKAIAIKPGNVEVPVANPEKLFQEIQSVQRIMDPYGTFKKQPLVTESPRYTERLVSCSFCGGNTFCVNPYYLNVPKRYSGFGHYSTVGYCGQTGATSMMDNVDVPGDYSFERNLEMHDYEQDMGLNSQELGRFGKFLSIANLAGKVTNFYGEKFTAKPLDKYGFPTGANLSPELVAKHIKAVSYREGEGDIWAEGTPKAAKILGFEELANKTHKHGQGNHWDGRHGQYLHYPMWVITALLWAVACRNPTIQCHIVPKAVCERGCVEFGYPKNDYGKPALTHEQFVIAGAKWFGAPYAVAGWDKPELGYLDKEYPVVWAEHSRIMKCAVPACDKTFRFGFDPDTPDQISDREAELKFFNAVVGLEWTLGDMFKACERVINIDRAIQLRLGRTTAHDQSVIPYFEQPARYPDEPGPQVIEANKFIDLIGRYYVLRGWGSNGRPTRAKLEELELKDVADKLAALGKLA